MLRSTVLPGLGVARRAAAAAAPLPPRPAGGVSAGGLRAPGCCTGSQFSKRPEVRAAFRPDAKDAGAAGDASSKAEAASPAASTTEPLVNLTLTIPSNMETLGCQLVLCGSIPQLGAWNPLAGLQFTPCEGHGWIARTQVSLADATAGFEAKLVLVKDMAVTERIPANEVWEKTDANRLFKVTAPDAAAANASFVGSLQWAKPQGPLVAVGPAPSVQTVFTVVGGVPAAGTLKLVGSDPALGGWDVSKALVLSPVPIPEPVTAAGSTAAVTVTAAWSAGVLLPANAALDAKLVVDDGLGAAEASFVWEAGANRLLTVPAAGPHALALEWRTEKPAVVPAAAEAAAPTTAALKPTPAAPAPTAPSAAAAPAPAPAAVPAPAPKPAEPPRPPVPVLARFLVPGLDTKPGESLFLIGEHPVLGAWDPAQALPLEWCEGGYWVGAAVLPSNTDLAAKLVLKVVKTVTKPAAAATGATSAAAEPAGATASAVAAPAESAAAVVAGAESAAAVVEPEVETETTYKWEGQFENRTLRLEDGVASLITMEWGKLGEEGTEVSGDTIRCELEVPHKVVKQGSWVAVMGGCEAFGNWDLTNAAALKWAPGNKWRGVVELPAAAAVEGIEAKLVVTHHGAKEPEWENDLGPNRVIKAWDANAVQLKAVMVFGDTEDTRLQAVAPTLVPELPSASSSASEASAAAEQEAAAEDAPAAVIATAAVDAAPAVVASSEAKAEEVVQEVVQVQAGPVAEAQPQVAPPVVQRLAAVAQAAAFIFGGAPAAQAAQQEDQKEQEVAEAPVVVAAAEEVVVAAVAEEVVQEQQQEEQQVQQPEVVEAAAEEVVVAAVAEEVVHEQQQEEQQVQQPEVVEAAAEEASPAPAPAPLEEVKEEKVVVVAEAPAAPSPSPSPEPEAVVQEQEEAVAVTAEAVAVEEEAVKAEVVEEVVTVTAEAAVAVEQEEQEAVEKVVAEAVAGRAASRSPSPLIPEIIEPVLASQAGASLEEAIFADAEEVAVPLPPLPKSPSPAPAAPAVTEEEEAAGADVAVPGLVSAAAPELAEAVEKVPVLALVEQEDDDQDGEVSRQAEAEGYLSPMGRLLALEQQQAEARASSPAPTAQARPFIPRSPDSVVVQQGGDLVMGGNTEAMPDVMLLAVDLHLDLEPFDEDFE